MSETESVFLFFLIGIIGILPWCLAVRDLMGRDDAEFAGRYDKLAWTILLTFTWVLGALVYFFRREVFESDSQSEQNTFKCIECGALIPETQHDCPKCGWTYAKE